MDPTVTQATYGGVDFSSTGGLGLSVTDVIETGFSFMGLFDTYTMLVLGIIFAPVAIGFIIWLWRKLPRKIKF